MTGRSVHALLQGRSQHALRHVFRSPVMRRALGVLFLLAASASLAAQSQTKRPITAQDLWAFQRVGAPVLSPDGKTAVFAVTDWSIAKSKSTSSLWLVDVAGGDQPQIRQSAEVGVGRLALEYRTDDLQEPVGDEIVTQAQADDRARLGA